MLLLPWTLLSSSMLQLQTTQPKPIMKRSCSNTPKLEQTSKILQALLYHPTSTDILLPSHDGHKDTAATYYQFDVTREGLMKRFSVAQLRRLLYRVGDQVKDNTSSMLQDVRAGKPTEIRDFNGWLIDTAALLNRDLPVSSHRIVVELVEGGVKLDVQGLGRYLLQ